MANWYVVHTKPKKEREAEVHLQQQEFETRLPLLRRSVRRRGGWQETVEPMFPRYLFIHLSLGAHNIAPIRSTRGVTDLVRFGGGPTPLPDGLVEAFDAIADTDTGIHHEEPLVFQPGDLLSILEGPFAGQTARFEAETGEGRVMLLLELLGRPNRVSLKRDVVRPAH